ncbi:MULTISPECIES: porin [Burkholderia]|uniref:porin n=1 Tax=Burkholderia TaxID=32008 RepID=UPI000BF49045|nr:MULTISPECIES: porin [Burkholderia]PFH20915.1 GBP family porin [Burkholderia sp. JKS000303]
MKKSLLAAGVSGMFMATAHAQSSVTLYGIIDAGVTYTSNSGGKSSVAATSGTLSGSRFGLTGKEELGGGWKAIFTLENGFDVMNGKLGQSSRMFGRQAFVGLANDRLGTLTLGRQYDSVVDTLGALEMSGIAHPYDNDNVQNSFRISNSVKYQSVNYGGLKFTGLYGFSNSASGFANNRAYSFGASYNYGGLNVGAGYLQLGKAGSSTNTSGAVSDDTTFTASSQRTWGAGANYAFGQATVGAMFTQTRLSGLTGIGASASGTSDGLSFSSGSARFNNYEVQARYNFTPAFSVTGAYTYTEGQLAGVRPKWNQIGLTADYALSKRTDVYLQAAYQHVHGAGDSGVTATIDGLSASSANHQSTVTVGLRHSF